MPKFLPASFRLPMPVVFISDYTLVESVQRLRAIVLPPGFDAESSESIMGMVAQDYVRLEHSLPWPNAPLLRPYFTGSFQQRDGRVLLTGRFVESVWTRLSWSPFNRLFCPSFQNEVLWLSAIIDQALTYTV